MTPPSSNNVTADTWSASAHIGWNPKPRLNVAAACSLSECAVPKVASRSMVNGSVGVARAGGEPSRANCQAVWRAALQARAGRVLSGRAT